MAGTQVQGSVEYSLPHSEWPMQNNLLNEGEKIKERIENLEKHSQSFTPEAKNELQELKQHHENLLIKYKQLLTLPAKFAEQQKEIEQLNKENEALTKRVEQLELACDILEVGQVMMEFSHNVSKFVLEPEEHVGPRSGLIHMLQWLDPEENHKNKDEEVRKKLTARWERLQSVSNMNWTKRYQAIHQEIKSNRHEVAHSIKFDETLIKQQVKNYWPHWEDECDQMIAMHKKLNHLLVLGAFSSDFEKVVLSYILPGEDDTNVSQLIKWLKENKLSEEGKAANQRWVNLTQLGTGWNDNHETALQEMAQLKRRKTILHEIDFEEAKTHVVDYVSSQKECFEIIDMMKILSKLSGKHWELPKNRY